MRRSGHWPKRLSGSPTRRTGSPADPSRFAAATVRRLQKAGAPVHLTAWESAPEQTVNNFYRNRLGTLYCHEGDWSWIYFFNNQCTDASGESLWHWLGQQKR